MGQLLMENAFEAWIAAVRYCKDIKEGKCTLQYQKGFVSSLHNAVELFLKQMMLNNNDHRVVVKKKITDEQLKAAYEQAKDLNAFFEGLNPDILSSLYTIEFNKLISKHRSIIGTDFLKGKSLKNDLSLLNQLRNEETHFVIHQINFLPEEKFCVLHNFMIRFYYILETWHPKNTDIYDRCFYPYWVDDISTDNVYVFAQEPLQSFSYETAVRESALTKEIAEFLAVNDTCGADEYSPYSIANDLIAQKTEYVHRLDEVWAVIQKMLSFGLITVEEMQGQDRIVCHM